MMWLTQSTASQFFEAIDNYVEKKTLVASEQKHEDVVEQRNEWQQIQEVFDIEK